MLPRPTGIVWQQPTTLADGSTVKHTIANELRVHHAPLSLYRGAHKEAFFEPRPGTLALYQRYNEKVKELVTEWWERIEDSRAFATNLGALKTYHRTLRPGDVTLVGLIAEGGQGIARPTTPASSPILRHAAGSRIGRAGRRVEHGLARRPANSRVYRQAVTTRVATLPAHGQSRRVGGRRP